MTVPRRSNGASNREKMLQEEEHLKHRKAAMRKKLKQQGEFHPGQITQEQQLREERGIVSERMLSPKNH